MDKGEKSTKGLPGPTRGAQNEDVLINGMCQFNFSDTCHKSVTTLTLFERASHFQYNIIKHITCTT